MLVPNQKYPAPLTIQPVSTEQMKVLIERVLDRIEIIEQDDEAAEALIVLVGLVADEKNEGTRKMIGITVRAAIYARTEGFYNDVEILSAGARVGYLTPRGTPQNRGKKQNKPGI
jgi:hypothetical protein